MSVVVMHLDAVFGCHFTRSFRSHWTLSEKYIIAIELVSTLELSFLLGRSRMLCGNNHSYLKLVRVLFINVHGVFLVVHYQEKIILKIQFYMHANGIDQLCVCRSSLAKFEHKITRLENFQNCSFTNF